MLDSPERKRREEPMPTGSEEALVNQAAEWFSDSITAEILVAREQGAVSPLERVDFLRPVTPTPESCERAARRFVKDILNA